MNRLQRLLASLGLLLASTVAVFAFLEAVPGGPATAYLHGSDAVATDLATLQRELGADRPLFVQYFVWIFRVARGDLGWSSASSQPVSQMIAEHLPATIELAFFGLFTAIMLGAATGWVPRAS